MSNAGLNKIDLSKYIKSAKNKNRNRSNEVHQNKRFEYKLPSEITCLHDEVHMINKPITAVNNLEDLRKTINLFGYTKRFFSIPEPIVNFVKKNGQTNASSTFSSHFAVDKAFLESKMLGKIKSVRNFINWLKYDVKTKIYSSARPYTLKDEITRHVAGKPINSKAIMLHTILDTVYCNEIKRNILVKSIMLPFSMAAVDIKLTDDKTSESTNPEGAEALDKFYVSINNIEGSMELYVNALRIVRALFRSYDDPTIAYAAGMEVCRANLYKDTSIYDNLITTYSYYVNDESNDSEKVEDKTQEDSEVTYDKTEIETSADKADVETSVNSDDALDCDTAEPVK